MPSRRDPVLTGDRFSVELEGSAAVLLAGVSFPTATIELAPRGAGRARYGPLIFRRPLSGDRLFSNWWKAALKGGADSVRNGKVSLLAPDLKVAAEWKFTGARPNTLSISPLDASSAAVITETLELTVETFEREL
ncbi:MAG: phage tail protein [Bryobacterales bacterium]|nr:phage tail protein [Bryobacterales bacterium]